MKVETWLHQYHLIIWILTMKLYSFLCNEKLYICVWRRLSGHLCHLSHFSTSANILDIQLCLRTLRPGCLRDCSAPWRSYVTVKVHWERIDCWGPRKGRKSRTLEPRASCSIVIFTVCAKRLKVSACKVAPGQPGVITAGLPFHQLPVSWDKPGLLCPSYWLFG